MSKPTLTADEPRAVFGGATPIASHTEYDPETKVKVTVAAYRSGRSCETIEVAGVEKHSGWFSTANLGQPLERNIVGYTKTLFGQSRRRVANGKPVFLTV